MPKRKTHDQFLLEMKDAYGDEYMVLGTYKNNSTKVLCRHNDCGYEWEVNPNNVLRKKSRCPRCSNEEQGKKKRKSHEAFLFEVKEQVQDEYTVLGQYSTNKTPIKMKHNLCGHEYLVHPSSFISGTRCPSCFRTAKKTTEQFIQEVFDLVGDDFTVLGEYVDNHTHLLLRHNTCGFEWDITPNGFLRNQGCLRCSGRMKKTTKQFKTEMFEKVGNEYSILGEYIHANENIKIKHHTCGTEWDVRPSNFLNKGSRCPACFGTTIKDDDNNRISKRTHDMFLQEVNNLVQDEYLVLGEYVDLRTKISMKHQVCGHTWDANPGDFLHQQTRCPECFGSKKRTTEEFKEEVFLLVGDEYSVLDEYTSTDTKLKMKHVSCRREYEVTPYHFLSGKRCVKCRGLMKKSTKEFKEEVFRRFGHEFTVMGEYVNSGTPIPIKHEVCGYEWGTYYRHFLKSGKCPKCVGKVRLQQEEFVSIVEGLTGDEYTVMGEYKNSNTKIEMRHNKCGHVWKVSPPNFTHGNSRCPKCNESKGEKVIWSYLVSLVVNFEQQHWFSDCRDKNPLPFDFAVFNEENELMGLIEYDGQQHFEPIKNWGGELRFKEVQRRDGIKNDYCQKNHIPLLRIPYYEFKNIPTLLDEWLSQIGK
ncbi:hypothetical protein D068_cds05480 [Bacillus atrophaeus UCMB-5137]|uniref:hypothetical protein n=1 Tax=Bacillus atrophaeus TaxID=1452 RepID=UPI00032D8143|nr:hypothetical protein [Bacillus atrophaeus]AKL83309.1 hypothetical protein D068_cds05480 [Bacillus atrophaeus UCMB-5137]